MKTVALFGGSFNPPHLGHGDVAKYICKTIGVDELWFLFSLNWQKNLADYAPTEHLMAMGDILAEEYPDMPFVMSDIQNKLGTHETYDVLQELEKQFPDTKFVWVMGADNLESFHSWKNHELIIENYPIAVLNRPPYTDRAKQSKTALDYAHYQTDKAKDLLDNKVGWHFLDNPDLDLSSSQLLKDLRAGKTDFDPRWQGVFDYIQEHDLYDLNAPAPSTPKTTFKPNMP